MAMFLPCITSWKRSAVSRPAPSAAFPLKLRLEGNVTLTLLQFLTLLLFVVAASSASAGPINVSGSVDYGPGLFPSGVVSLIGDRGFTFNGFVFGGVTIFGPGQCIGVPAECSPGTPINLAAAAFDTDVPGQGTLDGIVYPNVGTLGIGAHASITFTGQVVAPDFGPSPTAIVTVPVGFTGTFNVDGVGPNQLIAAARATLTLQQIDCCGGPAWVNGGIHYELAPVPEPATLLLFGTTAAGLGLARWRQWRRGQQQP